MDNNRIRKALADRAQDLAVWEALLHLKQSVETAKPQDRSEKDRLYALLYTDIHQKMMGFYKLWLGPDG